MLLLFFFSFYFFPLCLSARGASINRWRSLIKLLSGLLMTPPTLSEWGVTGAQGRRETPGAARKIKKVWKWHRWMQWEVKVRVEPPDEKKEEVCSQDFWMGVMSGVGWAVMVACEWRVRQGAQGNGPVSGTSCTAPGRMVLAEAVWKVLGGRITHGSCYVFYALRLLKLYKKSNQIGESGLDVFRFAHSLGLYSISGFISVILFFGNYWIFLVSLEIWNT